MTMHESTPDYEGRPLEIERKWLITALPEDLDLSTYDHALIRQGYLLNTPQVIDRVRSKGGREFFFARKEDTGVAGQKVEQEFDSLGAMHAFEGPDWFGPDMTGREEFSNALIAVNGFPIV